MVAAKDSREIHINTQRLSIKCTVFQAELYGISMEVDWIQSQGKKTSSYAISVDSKAALLAIANKHTTHPLAVATRLKTIELSNSTSITFHWVKGHAGLKGNERADYLAKTVASDNTKARAEPDGTRAETRFCLSPKRTSRFKSAGESVQSTAGSRCVRISVSNAGYTTSRGRVRVLATHSIRQFPLHFPSRASPCATTFQTQYI